LVQTEKMKQNIEFETTYLRNREGDIDAKKTFDRQEDKSKKVLGSPYRKGY
jgi:hypothetical protein